MSRQLVRRLLQKSSLKNLRQGGTFSVKSVLPHTNEQQVHVKIVPSWREDGVLTLDQVLVNNNEASSNVRATIKHEQDMKTSMGRLESHVSVLLNNEKTNNTDGSTPHGGNNEDIDNDEESSIVMGNPGDITLTAQVPEKVNVSCELPQGGSITITGKIEGDVHLRTSNGNINVTKLRGHNIHMETQSSGNTIYASDVLEAQSIDVVTPGRVRAKRMHGTAIHVQAHGEATFSEEDFDNGRSDDRLNKFDVDDEGSVIDISSLYVSGEGSANLLVSKTNEEKEQITNRAARVKSSHGHVSVEAMVPNPTQVYDNEPIVELGGVNGSCDVNIQVVVGDNDDNDNNKNNKKDIKKDPFLVGQVHFDSVSPDSISFVTSNFGDLSLTLDRKLETDIRLVSSPNISLVDSRTIMVEDDSSEEKDSCNTAIPTALKALTGVDPATMTTITNQSEISIDSEAFTERTLPSSLSEDLKNNAVNYVDGWVENKSHEPDSRFDVRAQQTTIGRVGKIRIDSAATQALSGFTKDNNKESSSNEKAVETERALLVGATSGKITLENLSWLGAIARRYGLQEDGRELGRTATRSGRSFQPSEE